MIASEIPVAGCGGLKNLLYRLVCSDRCEDGVYLAKVYENDSTSGPERSPYPQGEFKIETRELTTSEALEERGDEFRSMKTPRAFRE